MTSRTKDQDIQKNNGKFWHNNDRDMETEETIIQATNRTTYQKILKSEHANAELQMHVFMH